ncbi:uncharacterized protein [Haliotis cracherodii]|uniref:uncharacterized protein n=1 Tax=Haliotis cracherodii TaxID=6455 RepID=UPI0039E81E50
MTCVFLPFVLALCVTMGVCSITFNTQGYADVVNPMNFGFDIRGKDWITYKIMACKDFNIRLYFREQVMYRMLLGGWFDTQSRFFAFGTTVDFSGSVLNCTGYLQFWTSWEDGHFKIGRGKVKDADILYNDTAHLIPGVDSFTVNAPSAKWIFEYDNCTGPPDTERMDGVRYQGGFLLKAYSHVSGAFCVTECVIRKRCFSLSFSRADKVCELFTTPINTTDVSLATGWETYIFTDMKLYH